MSNPQPNLNVASLVENLAQDLEHQLDLASLNDASRDVVNMYLISDIQSIRFQLVNDALTSSDIWKALRSSDAITDLVMELTTSLIFHAECQFQGGSDQLAVKLVAAMSVFNSKNIDPKICALDDDDERERFATPEQLTAQLKSNPWLMTLFLLRRTDTVRKLLRTVAITANAARAKAAGKVEQRTTTQPANAPTATG